jgi:hypothetical protein
MHKVNPSHVHKSLHGIAYPSSRDEIIEYARRSSGENGIVDIVEHLSHHKEYQSESELMKEVDALNHH